MPDLLTQQMGSNDFCSIAPCESWRLCCKYPHHPLYCPAIHLLQGCQARDLAQDLSSQGTSIQGMHVFLEVIFYISWKKNKLQDIILMCEFYIFLLFLFPHPPFFTHFYHLILYYFCPWYTKNHVKKDWSRCLPSLQTHWFMSNQHSDFPHMLIGLGIYPVFGFTVHADWSRYLHSIWTRHAHWQVKVST